MYNSKNQKKFGFFRRLALRKVAKQVRAGFVPKGYGTEEIYEALKLTKPRGVCEFFGFLYAKVYDKHGNLKRDYGLVGVREITSAFVKLLVDGLCDSSVCANFDHFICHAMGDGSTDETDSETALVSQQDNAEAGSQTHGATSNIFRSVKTIVSTGAYTVIEHGIFNATTAGATMLDRTKMLSEFTVATDDEVAWTYDLTATAGG